MVGDSVVRRPVTLGSRDDARGVVAIESGLQAGERVIVSPGMVPAGSKVRVQRGGAGRGAGRRAGQGGLRWPTSTYRGPSPGSEEEARKAPGGGLSGVAIRRPVFTAMMMFGLIVLGIFGFRRLPIDEFPDVDIPVVAVQTVYPGASPETIEREVTRRLEEAFNTVEGVDRITCNSLEGVSSVVVEFDLARDGDLASQDIRARIDERAPRPADGHRGAGGAEVRPLGAADPLAGALVRAR